MDKNVKAVPCGSWWAMQEHLSLLHKQILYLWVLSLSCYRLRHYVSYYGSLTASSVVLAFTGVNIHWGCDARLRGPPLFRRGHTMKRLRGFHSDQHDVIKDQ